MSLLQTSVPTLVEQTHYGPSSLKRAETGSLRCLVVSGSQSRRNVLLDAATEAGWEVIVCADMHRALAVFRRTSFQLALVDLDSAVGPTSGFRDLCEILASDAPQLLLSICGHEGSPEEEIWARQLGCWLYLPGATNSVELSLLCEQARQVVDKQHRFTSPAFH